MTVDERIQDLYDDISRIAKQRGHEPPTTIIMNQQMFIEWYEYCQAKDKDHRYWNDIQIIVDKHSPIPLSMSYHPDQRKEIF